MKKEYAAYVWKWVAVAGIILAGWYGLNTAQADARDTVATGEVQCRVELDRAVLPAGGTQRAIVKVTLDPPLPPESIGRPPVNLAIVLDRSGSMAGDKLRKAKEAAIEALRRLGPEDLFSVVVYDHNAATIVPAQRAKNIEWIEGRIRSIRAGGNTALFSGVSQGASEVRKHLDSDYVHRIILLSDGRANVGPSSPADLGRLGAALSKEHISVTTVGVGYDYNEDLMTRLSGNSDGNAYFVESSQDLPHIFAKELGDVLNVVAQRVRVIIECAEGIRPLRIIGRDGRIRDRAVELSLNQLYGGKEKYVLVEVEIPGHAGGHTVDVARATVYYADPFTRRNESASGHTMVQFSDDSDKIRQSVNIGVTREYHLNLNAIAQEKAISLSDKGKKDEAIRELKKSGSELRRLGKEYKDKTLLHEAEKIEAQAARIDQEGMTSKYRKSLRTDSYQKKTQQ